LYGYPREPETTDAETPDSAAPLPRVSSEPVAVPAGAPAAAVPAPALPPEPASTGGSSWAAFELPTSKALAEPLAVSEPELEQPMSFGASGLSFAPIPETGLTDHGANGHAAPATVLDPPAPQLVPEALDAPVVDSGGSELPEIAPWDRKPLMIVIAAAAVLVIISIISGIASAAMFTNTPVASWRDAGSQTPAPDPTPSAAPAPAAPVDDTITLSGVGDVIMGSTGFGLPPNDGAGFFNPVKAALASDLVMGNLDITLSDPTGVDKCGPPPHENCFQLALPPRYASYHRDGGFQLLNLANNHTNDMGPVGLANTRAALTSAGLQYTGGIGQITYMTVKGVKVAILGFSVYSWGANLNNIPASVQLVQQAAAQADLVVIQMQGGAEGTDKTHVRPGHEFFAGEDRGDLIAFSHAVIDAGADVIFGHGPHVMRGMEFYKGRLIAYSLGNFCGYRVLSTAGYSGVGGILKVTLHKDGSWAGGTLVATEMVNGGLPAVDTDLRALPFVDGLSKADFGANAARISATDGKISPPV
jgi:hypothetical protein